MLRFLRPGGALVGLVLVVGAAVAADQEVLGRKLVVRDPTGDEPNRVVSIQGREHPTSLTLTGDPTAGGASLTIVANGGAATVQHLTLDASGWSVTPVGFTYRGPTTGDPVRSLSLRRTPTGVAVIKAKLRGNAGTTDLAVTPPNPGDDGGLVLAIAGGDRYCVSFGGAAGGSVRQDTASLWHVANATGKPGCPVSTVPTTTTTTTVPFTCQSAPGCGGTCPAGYHCETLGSACFCFAGGTDNCANCDTACPAGDVCTGVVDVTPPDYLIDCGCVTPPVCGGVVCEANCPLGGSCLDILPFPPTSCSCVRF